MALMLVGNALQIVGLAWLFSTLRPVRNMSQEERKEELTSPVSPQIKPILMAVIGIIVNVVGAFLK